MVMPFFIGLKLFSKYNIQFYEEIIRQINAKTRRLESRLRRRCR